MSTKLIDRLIAYIDSQTNESNRDREIRDSSVAKLNVLYIFPLKRDYSAVQSLPESIHDRYEFHFIDSKYFSYSSKASSMFSLVSFIDECMQKVRTSSIDIVISTRDMADLVHAVLAHEFDHIKGPNYLSSFIALYKPYTKLFIDTDDPINYEIMNITDSKWMNLINDKTSIKTKTAIQCLLNTFKGKGFVKPPAASCSSLVGDFNDVDSFIKLLKMHNKHAQMFNHYLPDFVDKYITLNPYKTIDDNIKKQLFTSSEISNILLAEQFMDTPIKITVDGCVINKQIYIWGVIDSIYWSNIAKNECFVGCFMPSNLCKNICDALIEIYRKYVNRLISNYGFNDQFIDIEFFVIPKTKMHIEQCKKSVMKWKELNIDDVYFKLMEINARCFMQMTPIYRQMFHDFDGDPISTLLKIYDPNITNNNAFKFNPPKLKHGICGLNGYLPTFASGAAENLLDFEAAQKYIQSGEVLLAVQKTDVIKTVSQQGSLLAYANIIGESYLQCFNRLIQIGNELIKTGAPWCTHYTLAEY